MSQVLRELPFLQHPEIIVGLDHPDDCGVVRVTDDLAIVTTVDVFTPVVDNPFDYGRIAAINSLSDIYAMGARPVSAVSVAGFPDTRLPLGVLTEISKGLIAGAQACGVPVVGGHTVKNPEPLFGLAVTGIAHPDRLIRKGGAVAGDVLVLTKPLGIGVLTTALKNERLDLHATQRVTELMLTSNARASTVMHNHAARAATDVTGFGLLGHAVEMAHGAGLTMELTFASIPVLEHALPLAAGGVFPGGARTNLEAYTSRIAFECSLEDWQRLLLTDPQTSGGLLIAFPPERVDAALHELMREGCGCEVIGRFGPPGPVSVVIV